MQKRKGHVQLKICLRLIMLWHQYTTVTYNMNSVYLYFTLNVSDDLLRAPYLYYWTWSLDIMTRHQ